MYEDVPEVLRALHASGLKIGLISNTQRSLTAFQTHFSLEGIFSAAVSSYDHGYMKPHRSIFEAALRQVGVTAREAMMVGDSVPADIAGAVGRGMRAVLLSRSGPSAHLDACPTDVPKITSLRELPALL
jgi:putative hydrolase of the HAD superfamily